MKRNYGYIAGMIDGEGCIGLYRKKDKKSRKGFSYGPQLSITSKDKWFLTKLQKCYGGHIYIGGKSQFNGNIMWSLHWHSEEIRILLPKVLPYLQYKTKEAIFLLEALEITKGHRLRKYNDIKLEKLVDKIKLLKKDRR